MKKKLLYERPIAEVCFPCVENGFALSEGVDNEQIGETEGQW